MVVLPASVTAREALDTQRMLSSALHHASRGTPDPVVTVDASGLTHFDSSALAVLMECHRLAQAWGKTFEVRQPPSKLVDLARLYGVAELLMPTHPEVGTAGAAGANAPESSRSVSV